MRLRLPDSVYSPQDLLALTLEVQEYARWFSHNAIKQRVGGKITETQPALSAGTAQLLKELNAAKRLDSAGLDELVASLQDLKDTAVHITITLAAPAPNSLKTAIISWCRTNLSPSALVTFQFNSTILGGMVVRFGSRIFDWSFQRQIMASRQKFPEVLRSV